MCIHGSGSNYGESSAHGTSEGRSESCTTGISHSYMTGINRTTSVWMGTPIEAHSFWPSIKNTSASTRVRSAAAPLERRLRLLAAQLTLAEFHQLRTMLDDCFDEVLLNGV